MFGVKPLPPCSTSSHFSRTPPEIWSKQSSVSGDGSHQTLPCIRWDYNFIFHFYLTLRFLTLLNFKYTERLHPPCHDKRCCLERSRFAFCQKYSSLAKSKLKNKVVNKLFKSHLSSLPGQWSLQILIDWTKFILRLLLPYGIVHFCISLSMLTSHKYPCSKSKETIHFHLLTKCLLTILLIVHVITS